MTDEEKSIYKTAIMGLTITLVLSAVLGYGLAGLIGSWGQSFCLVLAIQFLVNYFYSDYRIRKSTAQKESILNERLDILSRNLVKFDCPCGEYLFEEVIYPGRENMFKCESCKQTVRINVDLTPVVITTPLTSDPLENIQKVV